MQAAVWIADWPVTSAELAGDVDAGVPAVVAGPRGVVSANSWARGRGVREGMGVRALRATCPETVVLVRDEQREMNRFEPVLRAIGAHVAQVVVPEAGTVVFAARGAVRTAGSPEGLAEALIGDIAESTGCEAHVGLAEGTLAALVAARSDLLLDEEDSRSMLRGRETRTLLLAVAPSLRDKMEECVELLERLGVDTLGAVNDLGAPALTTRFGKIGRIAWDLASGRDVRLAATQRVPSELVRSRVFEPPIERAQEAIFSARTLAAELAEAMDERSLSGGRLRIDAFMEEGRELSRSWAMDGGRARDIVDRVRWQLTSWIDSSERKGGLVRLELRLERAVKSGEKPDPLWGGRTTSQRQVERAVTHLQSLLGERAVCTPRRLGGRDVRECYAEIPWGEVVDDRRNGLPWPDALPKPGPALVHPSGIPVEIHGTCGHPLRVTGEGVLSCLGSCGNPVPARLARQSGTTPVRDYAGPWTIEERWWDPSGHRRRAYMQISCPDCALLLRCEKGAWYEEASYG